MTSCPLLGLLTGAVRPLGPRGVPSGIAKIPVSAPVSLTATGFAGDGQGDHRHHGGPEKAVHHYPFDHYAAWAREIGDHHLLTRPGAFGENLSTFGLTEEAVAIGDVFELGSAVIEISQGRQPCWRLNERFSVPAMGRQVQSSGRTGWYYRVLKEGVVDPGASLRRVERHAPEWTVARIWRAFYVDPLGYDELRLIADHSRLAERWRTLALRRIETRSIEDWALRLDGPLP
ncbi:molybdenum cofactor sulfurase [Azorhizobium oxalatiphilum]|uniref:Molybdenum cofactor sulfurase n=1 Tax=Azorhizobium oxalatiphilum TaxID=980631 RepID=A0A917FEN2_9HYPH|nr:MOSC domain-containing protein [Azorhizobium oxalatiphilum]GGF68309.1 molybdenum cofactor sulfurase [Azorhizobium oxalatiphilum]